MVPWRSRYYVRVWRDIRAVLPISHKWEGDGEDVSGLPRREPTRMSSLSPEYWRERAERVQKAAEELFDQHARETLVRIANNYELLAKRAEEQLHLN